MSAIIVFPWIKELIVLIHFANNALSAGGQSIKSTHTWKECYTAGQTSLLISQSDWLPNALTLPVTSMDKQGGISRYLTCGGKRAQGWWIDATSYVCRVTHKLNVMRWREGEKIKYPHETSGDYWKNQLSLSLFLSLSLSLSLYVEGGEKERLLKHQRRKIEKIDRIYFSIVTPRISRSDGKIKVRISSGSQGSLGVSSLSRRMNSCSSFQRRKYCSFCASLITLTFFHSGKFQHDFF